jgi:isopentenyldiphosphate isomerase
METRDAISERFDVLDEDGVPTGEVRPRTEVHARGLWHRAFHLFLVAMLRGEPHVLLQLRSHDKDTCPGKLDVAVGGHYRAGEGLTEVVREVEEEIGLRVSPADLTFLWTQRTTHVGEGYLDREHQDVLVVRRDVPPEGYAPDPIELAGLVAIPLEVLDALLAGKRDRAAVDGLLRSRDGSFFLGAREVGRGDFIPEDLENLRRAVVAARSLF